MKHLILAVLAVAPAAAQNTWYVDVRAAGPGDGSSVNPYQSIQTAIDAPTTGLNDSILVRPGVYEETVYIWSPKRLHLKSTDGPLVTVIRHSGHAVTAQYGSTVEGFTLVCPSGGAVGRVVFLVGGELKRCIVLGNSQIRGIYIDGGLVDHCVVARCGQPVSTTPYPLGVIRSSVLSDNATPFRVDDWAHTNSNFEITHCIVDHIFGSAPTTNIALPPLFRNATGHDFHLRSTSPCIDAGDPNDPLDPDGSVSDIGPIPFDPNYAPNAVYCTAKVNSQGCTPAIEALGTASSTAPVPFEISCANELNQRSGLLFYGYAPHDIPFQGGYLCVHAPVQRTPLLSSGGSTTGDDCSGVYVYDFNARVQSGVDPLLEPGREVFAQFWSRDPASSFNSNRSDALRFRVQP